jgi:hypothetical protein
MRIKIFSRSPSSTIREQPCQGGRPYCGLGLREGAIASSVTHDSHHIVVVGCDDACMARAANLVIASRGGVAAVGT